MSTITKKKLVQVISQAQGVHPNEVRNIIQAFLDAITAIDEDAVPDDARGEQGERCRDDLEHPVQTEPIHRRIQPMHQCRHLTAIAVLDATARQAEAQPFAYSEMGPLAVAKPVINLHADEPEKSRHTAVPDQGAQDSRDAQCHIADVERTRRAHGAAAGHALTSSREMRPDSACKSAGFSNLSVGFRSISIQ